MDNRFFKTDRKPEVYYQDQPHPVIRREIWRRSFAALKGINVKGRAAWGASEPMWQNEIIYYNTQQFILSSILNRIVLHHTNNSWSIARNEQKQQMRGYAALGYHFFIGRDGNVYEGRPIEVMGSHAGVGKTAGVLKDPDWGAIGIVLQGDYHHADDWFWNSHATKKQLRTLETLVVRLKSQYRIKHLLMHSEVSRRGESTICPGDHLVPVVKQLRKKLGLFNGK